MIESKPPMIKNKSGNESFAAVFLDVLSLHPFICAFLVCLTLTSFGFASGWDISGEKIFTVSAFLSVFVFVAAYQKYKKGGWGKYAASAFIAGSIIAIIFLTKCFTAQAEILFVAAALILLWLFRAYSKDKTADTERRLRSLAIMGMSFALKYYYVLRTPWNRRQHDVGKFAETSGHASVIEYLLQNKHLPDFDVRSRWAYYNPPLHHIISAGWVDFLENYCGVNPDFARESIQMLTLFYSTACLIIVYKVLRHFKFSGWSLYIPLAVFAFHPQFVILSASINNDILSITLSLAAILCTLKWYESPSLVKIIKIALAVGLGMMTKISVGLVAPGIALIFLISLIKSRKDIAKVKNHIFQYVVFGVICCPLGLAWGIRNYILYKVPINYVPMLSLNSNQYVGFIPFFDRVTDFSSKQFENIFMNRGKMGFYEYNPLIAALKSAVFGEWEFGLNFEEYTHWVPEALFWLSVLLAAVTFVLIIVYYFKKSNGASFEDKSLLFIYYVILLINLYTFSNSFPHMCSQDFRYIVPVLLVSAVFLGFPIAESQKNPRNVLLKRVAMALKILSLVFCGFSFLAYGICFKI